MKILYEANNGVHAFGYNSTESEPIEPIWTKSGALWDQIHRIPSSYYVPDAQDWHACLSCRPCTVDYTSSPKIEDSLLIIGYMSITVPSHTAIGNMHKNLVEIDCAWFD